MASLFLLVFLSFVKGSIKSFGLFVADPSFFPVTLRLYWANDMYQCSVVPIQTSQYRCLTNNTLISSNNPQQYYMQIYSNHHDAFYIDSIFVIDDNDNAYIIDDFCATEPLVYALTHYPLLSTSNNCHIFTNQSGTESLYMIGLDNDNHKFTSVKIYFREKILDHPNTIGSGYLTSSFVQKFGFMTSSDAPILTSGVLVTLVWNLEIIQCVINPLMPDTMYYCDVNQAITCFNNHRYQNQYKLLIENDHIDTLKIQSVVVHDKVGYYYGISTFCVNNNISQSGRSILDNNCSSPSQFQYFQDVCSDNANCNAPYLDIAFEADFFTKPHTYDSVGIVMSGVASSPLTCVPTSEPTTAPSTSPTSKPTSDPTLFPSKSSKTPTIFPSTIPSQYPSQMPSISTFDPSENPSAFPTNFPSDQPSANPSEFPTYFPSNQPSANPSFSPTAAPTETPTQFPSNQPSGTPSANPSNSPTSYPSENPSQMPTKSPTKNPTLIPTSNPSVSPTNNTTLNPSITPFISPTTQTLSPSTIPTLSPSKYPTLSPSLNPTISPSINPSMSPSKHPTSQTIQPTQIPSNNPTISPTDLPTISPTKDPTKKPSFHPTQTPTNPTISPTNVPTISPTKTPTSRPTNIPSTSPSEHPTNIPTISPTTETISPSNYPTLSPSKYPTISPSINPSKPPSINPTITPSISPTSHTNEPTNNPSVSPTKTSTLNPSISQSNYPTLSPSKHPTISPSTNPSKSPSVHPSITPSTVLTTQIDMIQDLRPEAGNTDSAGNINLFITVGISLFVIMFIVICIMCIIIIKLKHRMESMDKYISEQETKHESEDNIQAENVNHMSSLINDSAMIHEKQINPLNKNNDGDNIYSKVSASDKSDSEIEEMYVPVIKDEKKTSYIEMQICNILSENEDNSLNVWFDEKIRIPSAHMYYEIFVNNGYETMEIIQLLTEDKLTKIGIEKQGHIDKIMLEINKLKYNAQNNQTEGANVNSNDQNNDFVE